MQYISLRQYRTRGQLSAVGQLSSGTAAWLDALECRALSELCVLVRRQPGPRLPLIGRLTAGRHEA